MYLFYVLAHYPLEMPPFVGDGHISVACRHCKHDDIYDPSEFHLRHSDIELPQTYEARVEPSIMPRQPLLRTKYRDAKPTFGPHSLEDRPKAGALIARIISLSSEIDAVVAAMMGQMMSANTAPAMALFLSLRQSRVQAEALNAVAKTVLSEQDRELFGALMALRSGTDAERDALAHGRFGESPAIEHGLIWVDAFDHLQYELRVEAQDAVTDEAMQWLRERMFVYELADLERIARDAEALYHSIRNFTGYLKSPDPSWRAEHYPQLWADPRVRQALHQLRESARKKAQ